MSTNSKTWTALSAVALATLVVFSADIARAEVCNDGPAEKSAQHRVGGHVGRAAISTPAPHRAAAHPTSRPARAFAAKVQSRVQRASFTAPRSSATPSTPLASSQFNGSNGGDGGGGGGGGSK